MALFARGSLPKLIGVVHLLPLPGSPRPSAGLNAVVERAVADARALRQGGAHALIVENLGDAPFAANDVAPATVAQMTRVALAIRHEVPELIMGINILRNDAMAALAVAAATGAAFVRVNVHTGTMVTDQGVITGRARETLLERNRLGCEVHIAADVHVKHAAPLAPMNLAQVTKDTLLRGGASAVIVSGTGTGAPIDPQRLRTVREAAGDAPMWLGSGLNPSNATALLALADAAVVGTYLHRDGALDAPIDATRVAEMARFFGAAAPS